MKPFCILKTGTTIAGIPREWGDFEHWIARTAELSDKDWFCCEVSAGAELPPFEAVSGIVITGSPAMVTDRQEWSERSAAWLSEAVKRAIPTLGICYGHQLLAHALGGRVDYNPRGREIGTKFIDSTDPAQDDPLFQILPLRYRAHTTHSQSALQVPASAEILGCNDFDPHHAVRFAPYAWGVQYHPEFNTDIMRKYLALRAAALQQEGLDPHALMEEVEATPQASALLPRFVELVRER